jgi:predicted lipid-binding transport protein (Tim44 family)
MEFLDFGTIFFIVAAVIIFYQLRNVLGRRTGNERRPFDPYTARERLSPVEKEGAPDNIVSLPKRIRPKAEVDAERYADIDRYAASGTALNDGLRAIRDADPTFTVEGFLQGARPAYEMIVMAYADGDRKTLRNLLSREVFQGFDEAISAREQRAEKVQSSFVGIAKADIINAVVKDGEAQITVRIISELISATIDKAGQVIEGDPETVAEVKDVWTFARDTRSRDPNWKLIATEAED